MKVLIVNKFLHPNGGSETYIFEVGRCLETMGHEVQYFGMEHKGRIVGNHAGQYTSDMEFHGSGGGIKGKIRKLTYPFKIIYSRESVRKITQVLDDFRPDVVHLNNINFQLTPSVIEAIADYDITHLTKTRIVYTAHDSQWVCPGHLLYIASDSRRCFECSGGKFINCVRNRCIHGSLLRSVLGAFEGRLYYSRKTYSLVDTVICPSGFMKRTLETHPQLKGRCEVLHNFIPSSVSCEARPAPSDDRYVIYFGRYSAEKGIKTILEACRALPDINFIFAGSGPLEDEVESVPNIKNVGFKTGEELKNLIRGAAFCVFTSECHENCSFTVMESISYGTPVIASSTGGTPELVSDGVDGLLFEAGNTRELTEKVDRLWNDLDLTGKLREGCTKKHFMTVYEYCEKLLSIYQRGA